MPRLKQSADELGQLCFKLEGQVVRDGDEIEMWRPSGWTRVTFRWSGRMDDTVELNNGQFPVSYGTSGEFRWPR